MNRIATRTDPLGRTETYTYDLNGNLSTVTDRKGQTTTYTYDVQDRRIRTDYADGVFMTYEYDSTSRLLIATDSQTGSIIRTYDALKRLVSEVTPQGAITYAYDATNRRQSMQVNGLQPVAYAYDAASRLTGITQGLQTVAFTYDAANRRSTLTLPNGVTASYSYDAASRLIAQSYISPLGLLGDLTYGYDANGNRIMMGGSWARTGIPSGVPTSSYDPASQQVAFGSVAQTFDPNGNLLTQTDASGTTTYTWDARNGLVGINGPSVSTTFTYDALGRRTTKTMNGTATTFHYDGADIIRETGPTGDASYLRTLNIDETLTRTDASGTLLYLADALGSTVGLLDTSGALTTEYTYEPFGATQTSGVAVPNPFQFTGRENDGRGLYYYRARYMDPVRGRFIQEDPLGLTGGSTHLYQYVLNNPLNLLDLTGLVPKWMVPKQVIQNTQDTINDLSPGAFNQKELDNLTDKVISEIGLLEAKELADLAPIPGHPLELTKQQQKTLQDVIDRLRRKNPNDPLIKKLEDEWKKALKKGRVTIK